MRRGRKPKTAALDRLHGSPGKRKSRSELMPPAGNLVPSEQLDRVKHARGIWDHYLATAPLDMLKPVDAELLERLCVALALARQAMDDVITTGLMITSDRGRPMQNPSMGVVNRQTEIARKLASELGLPVTARVRLNAPEPPQPLGSDGDPRGDELDVFLDQHPDRKLN